MGGKGSGHHEKFDTPEKRQELFKAALEHIEKGYTLFSFPLCERHILTKYLKKYANEIGEGELDLAKQKGRYVLETDLMNIGRGICKGNPFAILAILNNRFEDWAESSGRTKVQLSGDKNNPIVVAPVNFAQLPEKIKERDKKKKVECTVIKKIEPAKEAQIEETIKIEAVKLTEINNEKNE